jgi:hypothetical protein
MNDRSTIIAQIGLTALFFVGYFATVLLFMTGFARVPADYKESFSQLLGLLTAGGLMILQFWFSRSRISPGNAN